MSADRKFGFVFRPGSFWVGAHRAADGARWCVNLLPCCTVWFGRPPAPKPTGRELLKMVFTRNLDGAEMEVACCGCPRCKNFVWAARTEIEPPKFCAYCGLQFEGLRQVSNEEIRQLQVF